MRLLRKTAASYSNGTMALVISGSYFASVIAAAVYALLNEGLAYLWLVLVTLPVSLLITLILTDIPELNVLLGTLGGLVQAWVMWLVLRGKRLSREVPQVPGRDASGNA